jgi:5-methylcytosine-specific restriction endonuclease McrA
VSARADRVPDAEVVTEEFNCSLVAGCNRPGECWPAGCCLRVKEAFADPRPGARKKDSTVMRKAILAHRECSCGEQASDAHHVLFRSAGGDDVVENIRPLCHDCHIRYHANDAETVREVGQGLLDQNVAYVLGKLGLEPGVEYLRRRYSLFISYRRARAILNGGSHV